MLQACWLPLGRGRDGLWPPHRCGCAGVWLLVCGLMLWQRLAERGRALGVGRFRCGSCSSLVASGSCCRLRGPVVFAVAGGLALAFYVC